MNELYKPWHRAILIFILWALVGVIGSIAINRYEPYNNNIISDYSIRQNGYDFINPLLECEIQNNWDRQKYIPFEKKSIERIKKEVIDTHSWMTIGLYVRNLNNGPWFGINENEKYSPASLMKVPILITFLKWIEQDAPILNKKILIDNYKNTVIQYYKPINNLIIGKEYTIAELLKEMIINSNNLAMDTLTDFLPTDYYTKMSHDLGIPIAKKDTDENYLSVKDAATFFRILYNASYLERDTSEYALKILSKVTFNSGLRAWVPLDMLISHKFGERWYVDELGKDVKQLHDCGIVYYPNYPYLICIVTKWDNFDTNAQVISMISKIVFEEISKNYPKK